MIENRLIQTYGRKRARGLSDSQKKDLENLYTLYGISVPSYIIHPSVFFEKSFQGFYVEIGFGRGEHLIENAINHPEIGFIGCEPFENGVAAALREVEIHQLKNVKIFKGDARLLLEKLEQHTINRFYVLFPDPWTKKRHHKRRILSVEFIKKLCEKCTEVDGELIAATDSEDYMLNILDNLDDLNISHSSDLNELSHKPKWFLQTRYEQKALSQGKSCYYLKVLL